MREPKEWISFRVKPSEYEIIEQYLNLPLVEV